jgi:Chitin binding Peritrophin-A domain
MKLLVLCSVLVGLASAQHQDPRCPMYDNSRTPTQFAHPSNCGSFLRCFNGMALEIQCTGGQHWNSRTNSCDSPQRAGCMSGVQRPAVPPQPQRPIIPNPRPQIEHPDYINCPFNDVPGQIVYFPYHLNCSQFYQCVTGRAVL